MKPRCTKQRNHALTVFEVLVILSVLAILLAVFLPALTYHRGGQRINCVNNLKQIGLSSRIWSGDNNDKYPFETTVTNGGTMEFNNGRNAWINFFVMSNELSTPKVLICPQDTKRQPAATNFSAELVGHISYFVGLNGNIGSPQSILSGDDNFETSGIPVKSGLIEISSNTPVSWSAARHQFAGNIVLADGDVQTFSNSNLTKWLRQNFSATNRLAIP